MEGEDIDPLNIIPSIQKRIATKNYKKGMMINYAFCILLLIMSNFGGLYNVVTSRLPKDMIIPVNSTIIEKSVDSYISPSVHPYFIYYVIITLLFSINSLKDNNTIIDAKPPPKCYSCGSPMDYLHLKCSNSKCNKEFK